MIAMLHRAFLSVSALCLGGTLGTRSVEASQAVGTYMVVHAEHLAEAAGEWAAYRQVQGWQVMLVPIAAAEGEAQESQRSELQQKIRETHAQAAPGDALQFAVLLLGDAPEPGRPGIPVWTFPQRDPVMQLHRGGDVYITDHPYQLLTDRGELPAIQLGRVPAQTVAEARIVLEKIKRYEAQSSSAEALDFSSGRNRVTYAAGEGHFGAMDSLLESMFKTMVDQLVPEAFELSMTYAKASSIYCPPPSKLADTVLQRMSEGSLLFNYLGHGFERGFDSLHWNHKRIPILRTSDFGKLQSMPASSGQLPIAFLSCCSVGWYDLEKGEHSLAETMLFHPAGPIAVIAGSRVTHPYANTVLQKNITRALLVDRAATVGMLDLNAMRALLQPDETDRDLDALAAPIAMAGKWKTGLRGLRQMHVRLYNLLGDPAVRLSIPAPIQAKFDDSDADRPRIYGTIDGMQSGKLRIAVEAARTSSPSAERLQAVVGDNDPDLDAKAAINYAIANDRTLLRREVAVADGRFEFAFDGALPMNAAIIRLHAVGEAPAQTGARPLDAIGAVRLQPCQPADVVAPAAQ